MLESCHPDGSRTTRKAAADLVAQRLDKVAREYERGWSGRPTQDGGLRFMRVLRSVEEVQTVSGNALRSRESRRLSEFTEALQAIYGKTALLERRNRQLPVNTPTELLAAVLEEGQRGLSLQRYKGLGEMNPDQLWETTLDPDARTLVQVRVEDVSEANDLFIRLMGSEVAPRRDFIVRNALSAENLDL